MSWRVARSLDQLLAQINAAYPNRSKRSDGSIGDAAHRSRTSDHNPWVRLGGMGIVTARDFTHDPNAGFDSWVFADLLRQECAAGRERRVKYIISNRRIASGTQAQWRWRRYNGSNPHSAHVHISVHPSRSRYDDQTPWASRLFGGTGGPPGSPTTGEEWWEMPIPDSELDKIARAVGNREVLVGSDKWTYDQAVGRGALYARQARDMDVEDILSAQVTKVDGSKTDVATVLRWTLQHAGNAKQLASELSVDVDELKRKVGA